MAAIQQESQFGAAFEVTGTVNLVEAAAIAPSSILRTTQDAQVQFDITTSGAGTGSIGGTLRLTAYFEGLGSTAPELDFGPVDVTLTPGPSPVNYFGSISIPANTIPPGTYQLVGVVSYLDLTNAPGPVAAFSDMQLLRVYA